MIVDIHATLSGAIVEFYTTEAVPTLAVHLVDGQEVDHSGLVGGTQGIVGTVGHLPAGGHSLHLVVALQGEGERGLLLLAGCGIAATHHQVELALLVGLGHTADFCSAVSHEPVARHHLGAYRHCHYRHVGAAHILMLRSEHLAAVA